MNRAVFLDRDGVINAKAPQGAYVTRWEQVQFLPGVDEAITLLNRAGFRVIIVTNQRCVAKQLVTAGEVDVLHQQMCDELAKAGATVHAVYYCPHEIVPPCECRKPAPGMLFQAARAHHIDLSRSWMVGDSDRDVQAGRNAGCKTARVLENGSWVSAADVVATCLLEAVHEILRSDNSFTGRPIKARAIA